MQFAKKYWKSILGLALVLALVFYAYVLGNRVKDAETKHQQALVLNEQQAQDKNVLQNQLDMSKQNAEMLANFIKSAQTGQIQPVTHFTIQAPTVQKASEQVAERINARDSTLPPVALEKTDNTIVVPNTNKTPQANYDVAVFKNNNYRNWEWSTGYGQHGSDRYIPIELQRNFSKDAAVSVEYHVGGREKGYEVKYTRKTDKLFLMF
ncbi:hypothetical protein [Pelosinus sp. IPA-1]|uniref:hypothetical protein n=1 Tax=Pelosinus sp. IPA-1 TaxID=3029569 RepID=UPI0024362A29|nr:hypothetical protein [Pelosinus sp. IPA-1]GMB01089.1 hypothetical protein PIPA1_38880 [Pelosinus sp. IPA-1]